MKTNNSQGRAVVIIIGGYLFLKVIVNMILGGGIDIGGVIQAVILFAAMFSGLQYLNIVVAAVLGLTVLVHLPGNIIGIFHNWKHFIYLLEGGVDVIAILLLILPASVQQHFTNKWSEIDQLFKS